MNFQVHILSDVMENANLTERSSKRVNEMQQVSSRLSKELREISKEEERQRLLNALSESETRNTELEVALAKLAREQDRMALFERERVLKRAQVAQATAALVYEANWARNRMGSEMRQTKLRAMVFNDPIPPPVSAPQFSVPEIVSAPSIPRLSTSAALKQSGVKSRRSSTGQSVATTVKADAGQLNVPQTIPAPNTLPPQISQPLSPSRPEESSSISPTVPDEPGITELVTSAAANVYGTLMSSYNSYTNTSPVSNQARNFPAETAIPTVLQDSAYVEEKRPSVKSKIASTPPLPDQRKQGPSMKFGPKVGELLPPRSPEDTSLKVRTIRNSTKGEWTNPQLLTEAEVTITMLLQERDEILWNNKSLLGKVFGVPLGTDMASSSVKPEWIELEEFWIQKAAKLSSSERGKKQEKIPIDSLIAEKAGVSANVLTDDKIEEEKVPEEKSPPVAAAPPEPGGEAPKKKKNGCVIM